MDYLSAEAHGTPVTLIISSGGIAIVSGEKKKRLK